MLFFNYKKIFFLFKNKETRRNNLKKIEEEYKKLEQLLMKNKELQEQTTDTILLKELEIQNQILINNYDTLVFLLEKEKNDILDNLFDLIGTKPKINKSVDRNKNYYYLKFIDYKDYETTKQFNFNTKGFNTLTRHRINKKLKEKRNIFFKEKIYSVVKDKIYIKKELEIEDYELSLNKTVFIMQLLSLKQNKRIGEKEIIVLENFDNNLYLFNDLNKLVESIGIEQNIFISE